MTARAVTDRQTDRQYKLYCNLAPAWALKRAFILSHRKQASGATDKAMWFEGKNPTGSNPCGNQNLFIQFIQFISENKQTSKQRKQASKYRKTDRSVPVPTTDRPTDRRRSTTDRSTTDRPPPIDDRPTAADRRPTDRRRSTTDRPPTIDDRPTADDRRPMIDDARSLVSATVIRFSPP